MIPIEERPFPGAGEYDMKIEPEVIEQFKSLFIKLGARRMLPEPVKDRVPDVVALWHYSGMYDLSVYYDVGGQSRDACKDESFKNVPVRYVRRLIKALEHISVTSINASEYGMCHVWHLNIQPEERDSCEESLTYEIDQIRFYLRGLL